MSNNATYKIVVQSPLLRPGLTITAEVSEKYVVDTTTRLMELVRSINAPVPPPQPR